jgi:hypothetical protein
MSVHSGSTYKPTSAFFSLIFSKKIHGLSSFVNTSYFIKSLIVYNKVHAVHFLVPIQVGLTVMLFPIVFTCR